MYRTVRGFAGAQNDMVKTVDIKQILHKLVQKTDITEKEAGFLAEEMMQGRLPSTVTAAVLTAFRMKGESIGEIVAFIKTMRKHMVALPYHGLAIDTCGTGGDSSGTFNISTASAFVVAGASVPVAKHGNRSASSKCGSADVLEALGMYIQYSPNQAREMLKKTKFTFLFAPLYHLGMKHVAPIRRELGIPTIFNYLGPFLNPVGTKRQIIGVPNKDIAERLAQVATRLSYIHLLILTADHGLLDEITLCGKTHIFEIKKKTVKHNVIDPKNFGMKKTSKKALVGGDAKENASIIKGIFSGETGPRRDIVLLNAGAALYVSGKAKTINDGIEHAKQSIDSGKASSLLNQCIMLSQIYANHT